jgi:hypothetical protein
MPRIIVDKNAFYICCTRYTRYRLLHVVTFVDYTTCYTRLFYSLRLLQCVTRVTRVAFVTHVAFVTVLRGEVGFRRAVGAASLRSAPVRPANYKIRHW